MGGHRRGSRRGRVRSTRTCIAMRHAGPVVLGDADRCPRRALSRPGTHDGRVRHRDAGHERALPAADVHRLQRRPWPKHPGSARLAPLRRPSVGGSGLPLGDDEGRRAVLAAGDRHEHRRAEPHGAAFLTENLTAILTAMVDEGTPTTDRLAQVPVAPGGPLLWGSERRSEPFGGQTVGPVRAITAASPAPPRSPAVAARALTGTFLLSPPRLAAMLLVSTAPTPLLDAHRLAVSAKRPQPWGSAARQPAAPSPPLRAWQVCVVPQGAWSG
jgi:hypothetical protein